MIDLLDVGVRYGARRALDAVRLTVFHGDLVCLLGPNGAGKSTLLRTVSGLLAPTSGMVRLKGQDVRRIPRRAVARTVAFVPQRVQLDFPFTVGEVVMMGRAPHQGLLGAPGPRDAACVAAALERLNLTALRDRRLSELSGGEAQRAMLAAALAQEPEVLLLDEPIAFLDLRYQVEVLQMLAELNAEREVTIIVSMHDLNLASLYGRRLVLLDRGRLHADGVPASVLTPAILKEVYGVDVHVEPHPERGVPQVLMRREDPRPEEPTRRSSR